MKLRLTAIAVLLAGLGPVGSLTLDPGHCAQSVPMIAENGRAYLVEPGERLGSAMSRGAIFVPHATQAEGEQGACVPEPMEEKPKDAVGCRCYEVTHCKGNESHECRRHCRKDLCQCCDI
jgi:hypothetical protein